MSTRIRTALSAIGRCIVDHLTTENGWFWAYGVWYPYIGPGHPGGWGCGDDQQP